MGDFQTVVHMMLNTRWRYGVAVRVVRSHVDCQSQQLDTIMYSLYSCSYLSLDFSGILCV